MNPRQFVSAIGVVLTVVAFGLSVSTLSKKDRAAQQVGLRNMKALVFGTRQYCCDNDDYSPPRETIAEWKEVVGPYTESNAVVSSQNPIGSDIKPNLSTCGVLLYRIPSPKTTPAYYESKTWKDKTRIVGFWDGHAQALYPKAWKKAEKRLHLPKAAFK